VKAVPFEPAGLALPGVRGLSPYQPGKPLEALEREYGIRNAIKLASNENPLGPGPAALAAARAALSEAGRYPDGSGFALKRALADRLGVEPSQITLGNGSNDVLELVARAFLTPENEVVYSAHAFAVYGLVTQAAGARAVVVPARDWGHDLAAMRASVGPRTRLVFIANPNNPTGTWLGAQELERLVSAMPRHVLVVVDEAYFEYVEETDYPDTVAWIARYPNLITTRTFSKVHGLAGLRVGYGVSHPAVADLLNRVRQPFNVNSAAAAAAEAALSDAAHLARSRDLNRTGLRQLIEGAERLGLSHIPSAGNFVCIEVGDAATVYEGLLREGVIVRPVANYGMPNHLRVTVGLPDENERFLMALEHVLGGR
jgi:histidinol-phosphate aminotransferase